MRISKKARAEIVALRGVMLRSAIAAKYGISWRHVCRIWEKAGVPTDPEPGEEMPAGGEPISEEDQDRMIAQAERREQFARRKASDASLLALQEAHGSDPRQFMHMPREFIDGELPTNPRNFDPEVHARFAARILKSLEPFARHRDSLTRALTKIRNERLANVG